MNRLTLIFSTYGQGNQPFLVGFYRLLKQSSVLSVNALANKVVRNEDGVYSYVPSGILYKLLHFAHFHAEKYLRIPLPEKPRPLLRKIKGTCHVLNAQQYPMLQPYLKQVKKHVVSFRGYETVVRPKNDAAWKNTLLNIYQNVDALHFVSDYLKDEAIKLGAPQEKCVTIYRSVDDEFFRSEKRVSRAELSIISVGRLTWQKGFKHGIKAMQLLKQRGLKFSYKIFGEDEEKENLEQMIQSLALQDCVEICEHIDHQSLKEHYQSADILLVPSETDALPNVILEASAMELPIVASNVGGIAEAMIDRETGFLVESMRPDLLADALETLMQNEEKRRSMGAQARKFVTAKFGSSAILKQWENFYQSL